MTINRRHIAARAAIFSVVGWMAATTPAASAKSDKAMRAPAVQTVLDCRTQTESDKRLACFDAAVAAMADAEVKGDLVSIDREQRREVRRQAFGLTLPAFTMFDRGEKSEDADRISATVTEASRGANGRWLIQLEGGPMWRQTDDTDLYKTPHPGSVAVVKRGSLGSFFMKIDGDTAFRVHRDN